MNFPRSSAYVILFALLIVALSVIGSVGALAGIPNLRLTQTPHPSNYTPTPAPEFATIVQSANDLLGASIVQSYGCAGCHLSDNGVAPSFVGLKDRAANRRPGYSAEAYVLESIINPNAYIVEGYPAGVMPQDFSTRLKTEELYAVVKWVLEQ
ncbi:MAG: hypothetical protein U0528_13870 [Anaerolineae bacterium]|nr:cytochrome c [Anaerolineae bacterium]